jgi:hypothetical protein
MKYVLDFHVLYEVLFLHGIIRVSNNFIFHKMKINKIILDVWKTQQRSLISLLICTLIIYITLVIVFLPFRLIVWLISFAYTFAPSVIEWFEHVSSARTLLFKLVTFIPLLAVFIMNNLLGI